jgi:hypothetical protein
LADPGDPEAPTLFFGPAGPLAVLLDVCDPMFAEDLDDAYHLNISAGSFNDLRAAPLRRPTPPSPLGFGWWSAPSSPRLASFSAPASPLRGGPPSHPRALLHGLGLHQRISTLLVHGSPPSPLGVALVV